MRGLRSLVISQVASPGGKNKETTGLRQIPKALGGSPQSWAMRRLSGFGWSKDITKLRKPTRLIYVLANDHRSLAKAESIQKTQNDHMPLVVVHYNATTKDLCSRARHTYKAAKRTVQIS